MKLSFSFCPPSALEGSDEEKEIWKLIPPFLYISGTGHVFKQQFRLTT